MANPSLQIGNSNWAIKEDNLLGYSTAGTRFVPQPITMTRESAGTRVNSSGLVETVELLGSELVTDVDFLLTGTQAENITGTYWTTGTGWTISGGNAILDGSQTVGSSLSSNNMTVTVGKIYKVTVNVSATSTGFRLYDALGVVSYGLSLGENVFYRTPSSSTYTVTPLGLAGATGTISNVSVKEYAANNLARVDYDGTASSLLVEPMRINVNTYSEDFAQSFYIKDSGVSVGTTNNVSPSGESNATKIDVTDNGRIYANVASDTYASSWYIKAGTFSYFRSGGDIDLVAGTFSGGTIESVGNGWFRITKQYTGNRPFQIQAYPDGTYSSHTTTGDYYIWGSQIEVGSYPTSYIPTDGGTVTRVQDQYSKTGISNLINSEEGTFFVEMAALSELTDSRVISINNGTSNYYIWLNYKNTSNTIRYVYGFLGTNYADLQTVVADATLNTKIAMTWKLNEFKFFINGFKISEDLSGAVMPSGTLNKLEFNRPNGTEKMNGKVKQLQVFKTALTDSELIALTTI